tara:strand:- start:187 stop:741 length:555 start_codon:yes stop_codon:yes gene_type:complete
MTQETDTLNAYQTRWANTRPTVLAWLRFDAEAWWGYKGDRPAQRQSIRESVKTLRAAIAAHGYYHEGRGGGTIRFAGCSAGCHKGKARAARYLLPWVDTTTVDDADIFHVATNLPMILPDTRATEADLCPVPSAAFAGALEGSFGAMAQRKRNQREWSGLDQVPLGVYRELAEPFGATFGNIPT